MGSLVRMSHAIDLKTFIYVVSKKRASNVIFL
jgi:hypothetical protein